MIDLAGNFGSRADLNERNDIEKEFGFSRKESKDIIEAANVDVQKDYKWAGVAAGAVTTLATAGIGGLWSRSLKNKTVLC
jgi:hypothetical protein